METPTAILNYYWGYKTFRPLQEDIINSVLDNRDTFALLPTSGGKSICYQIPALIKPGICIVVSPLVALIKDQVESLRKKGIKAVALTGGISQKDIDILLDNCIYGNVKFLFLSPERLQQELVQERIRKMPVNLIAIDEAHCISQWGNDFRPSYRNCITLRTLHPKVPVIALTASATTEIIDDIVTNLALNQAKIFKRSFARPNLVYTIFHTEDKLAYPIQTLKKNEGAAIIYVRNRKATVDIAQRLNAEGITATFFHGGLSTEEKEKQLQNWLQNNIRVVVATTAFGMGIDKADVRYIFHLQYPDSIESYYQEAGRAGRDNKLAYAILLKNDSDEVTLKKQFLDTQPDTNFIKLLYRNLNNYLQIAYGEGNGTIHYVNFDTFCQRYNLNTLMVYNGLKILDKFGVLRLSETFDRRTSLQFKVNNYTLFAYFENHSYLKEITQNILRTYGGIFDVTTKINIALIAKKSNTSHSKVYEVLKKLEEDGIIDCTIIDSDIRLTFLVPREDDNTIYTFSKFLKQDILNKEKQITAVVNYAKNSKLCRSKFLLSYFGDKEDHNCGRCDICLKNAKTQSKKDLIALSDKIISLIREQPMSSKQLVDYFNEDQFIVLDVLRSLLDLEKITINTKNEYSAADI